MADTPVRAANGRFVKGQSGNKKGRPVGVKNQITELRQNLELAVRKTVKVSDVRDIITKMVDMAKDGDKGAAKLILDKVMPNASEGEDVTNLDKGINIVIQNVTKPAMKDVEGETIDQED